MTAVAVAPAQVALVAAVAPVPPTSRRVASSKILSKLTTGYLARNLARNSAKWPPLKC